LKMRPRRLKRRFVLFGIEFSPVGIGRRRQSSEEIDGELEKPISR
jgi:hypothetical protein